MTPYDPSAEENVNDASIRAGMKSLDGKYPVTVRYEKFDRAPYDPSARQAVFDDFWAFHLAHPELRFWQAVRAWSDANRIMYSRAGSEWPHAAEDTFYWETKDGK